jgi:TRAP-type mannitol/chloroaromatic compound transport system permease small subunit
MAARLDRLIGWLTAAGQVLVIPLSLLLFLQWPLRDLLGGYSREANDLGQVVFAFYISLAVSYATRARSHLAADQLARRYPSVLRRRLQRGLALLVMVPWSLFILYASAGSVWQSLAQAEHFAETFNPGYFLVKLCIWLLALLVCAQALLDGLAAEAVMTPDTADAPG